VAAQLKTLAGLGVALSAVEAEAASERIQAVEEEEELAAEAVAATSMRQVVTEALERAEGPATTQQGRAVSVAALAPYTMDRRPLAGGERDRVATRMAMERAAVEAPASAEPFSITRARLR
jgi:hypothetical protein